MRDIHLIRRDLIRTALWAIVALFAVPALTLLFTNQVLAERDAAFISSMEERFGALSDAEPHGADADPGPQQLLLQQIRQTPPSRVCAASSAELANYRANVCEVFDQQWQLYWTRQIALWSLVGALLALLAVGALATLAFRGRAAQYRSLSIAWNLLSLLGALAVTAQSVLLVSLSFWGTVFYFGSYSLKLVMAVALCAAIIVWLAISQIFRRVEHNMAVEGELVGEADAPALWARVRALAAQLGTAAPDQIVAGIDSNFFVIEGSMTVGALSVSGRSLFVSLPLLRILDQSEADAVLAHELAHLGGGDTTSSAALGPKLTRFDTYRAGIRAVVMAYYPLTLYRLLLEIALKQDSREREFMTDRAAAKAVAGAPLVRALIKFSAYAGYREQIENALFQRHERHAEAIGIAAFVAEGLHPFARSDDFLSMMANASVPHPFDSHPGLGERMRNVGAVIEEKDFGDVLTAPLAHTWSSEILTGVAIEQRLWDAYERRFACVHEHDLAYRYRPDTEEERALVLRYFPPCVYALNYDRTLEVRYAGLTLPDGQVVAWEAIKNIGYQDGLRDTLTLTLNEKGMFGAKKVKAKLAGIAGHREDIKAAIGKYWQRHQIAHSHTKQ